VELHLDPWYMHTQAQATLRRLLRKVQVDTRQLSPRRKSFPIDNMYQKEHITDIQTGLAQQAGLCG